MLKPIPIPAFSDNYIWLLAHGDEAVVVDPGAPQPVFDHLHANDLKLTTVLITHHHPDHIGGLPKLRAAFPKLQIYAPDDRRIPLATRRVAAGDRVQIASLALDFEVLEVPGHTTSHIAYYQPPWLFCGDTLFAGGCGRMFEGTPPQMLNSLDRLATLPGDTEVYCAHEYTQSNLQFAATIEPDNQALQQRIRQVQAWREQGLPTIPSTIGLERLTNPFLRCREASVVSAARQLTSQALESDADVFAAIRAAKDRA